MQFTYGVGSVTFNGQLYPVTLNPKRRQLINEQTNGAVKVRDYGYAVKYWSIVCKASSTVKGNMRNFYDAYIRGMYNAFTCTPDANQDMGNGAGNPVTVRCENYSEQMVGYSRYIITIQLRSEV